MSYCATFPAAPVGVGAIRAEMAEYARACGLDDERVGDVELAVSEAVTNAIVHGYGGEDGVVRVSATRADGELTIVVADDGCGLVPRTESRGLGLGLPLIANVTQRMEVISQERGTEIRMVFPCPVDADG